MRGFRWGLLWLIVAGLLAWFCVSLAEGAENRYVLIECADLTADGCQDLVQIGEWEISLRVGLGGQKYAVPQTIGEFHGRWPTSIIIKDVVGSDLPDLTIRFEDGHREVFEQLENGRFRPGVSS